MIGKKVSSTCLDDAELNFYRWDGELSDLLGKVPEAFASGQNLCHQYMNSSNAGWRRYIYPVCVTLVYRCSVWWLVQVKDQLNEVADTWNEKEKAHCLEETSKSFQVRRKPTSCFELCRDSACY